MQRFSTHLTRLLAAAMVLGAATFAQAQESRIAVVNSQRLLAESTMAKNSQAKLEKEFATRTVEMQDHAKRMQAMVEKFNKDEPVMSASEREKRQKELMEADTDFRRKQEGFTNDLNQRKNEELSKVLDSANGVIRQIAEQKKLDLIVQDGVYFNPRIDITDEVLRKMNSNAK